MLRMLISSSVLRRPELGQTYYITIEPPIEQYIFMSWNYFLTLYPGFLTSIYLYWVVYPPLIHPHPPTQMYRKEKITLKLRLVTIDFFENFRRNTLFFITDTIRSKKFLIRELSMKIRRRRLFSAVCFIFHRTDGLMHNVHQTMCIAHSFQIMSATWKTLLSRLLHDVVIAISFFINLRKYMPRKHAKPRTGGWARC